MGSPYFPSFPGASLAEASGLAALWKALGRLPATTPDYGAAYTQGARGPSSSPPPPAADLEPGEGRVTGGHTLVSQESAPPLQLQPWVSHGDPNAAVAAALSPEEETTPVPSLWGREYTPSPEAKIMRDQQGRIMLTNVADAQRGLGFEEADVQLPAEQQNWGGTESWGVPVGLQKGAFTPAPAMPSETLGWSAVMDNPDLAPGVKEDWKRRYQEKQAAMAQELGLDKLKSEAELQRAQAGLYGAQAEAVKDPRAGTTLQVMEYVRKNIDQYPEIEVGTMPIFRKLVEIYANIPAGTTIQQIEKVLGADKTRKLMELAREEALKDFVMSQHITLQAAMYRNPNYGLGG